MKADQIREQERRLAALTFDQSPCRAFRIYPDDGDGDSWIDVKPGDDGESFLSYWMRTEAIRRLQLVGLTELEPGVWTLALHFSGDRWAAYTLRAMAHSSWSGVLFPLADMVKNLPEGVVLDPEEVEFALELEADLIGLALPGESWTVLRLPRQRLQRIRTGTAGQEAGGPVSTGGLPAGTEPADGAATTSNETGTPQRGPAETHSVSAAATRHHGRPRPCHQQAPVQGTLDLANVEPT